MADTKISALTDGTPLASGDMLVVARSGADNRITWDPKSIMPPSLLPQGAIAQTFDRWQDTNTATANTSGTLKMVGIALPAGVTITSISFVSGATALATGTHQIFGIFDDDNGTSSGTARSLLRGTSDDTSNAWAANAVKTLNLTSTYTTTRAGFFYLGVLVAATTMPTFVNYFAPNATVAQLSPATCGNSSTGLSALPNPAAQVTVAVGSLYAYVS